MAVEDSAFRTAKCSCVPVREALPTFANLIMLTVKAKPPPFHYTYLESLMQFSSSAGGNSTNILA